MSREKREIIWEKNEIYLFLKKIPLLRKLCPTPKTKAARSCREPARRRPLIAAARQKPRAAGRPQAVVSAKLVAVQALKGIESVKSQSSPRPPEAEFLGELIYKSIINSNYYDLSAW